MLINLRMRHYEKAMSYLAISFKVSLRVNLFVWEEFRLSDDRRGDYQMMLETLLDDNDDII